MAFPNDFLWGAASSAVQIEGAWDQGGKCPSIWDVAGKHIKNGGDCHTASDHYHHYKEDVALMKEIGLKSYRFSVSWCRIMTEDNRVNPEGIAFYRDLIGELKAAGIEPMITLYHWDLPLWIHRQGGWKNPEIVDLFLDYAKVVVNEFSGDVRYWMTINEPQVFIMAAYLEGSFAPFERDVLSYKKCLRHCLLAHGRAVRLIRETAKTPPMIGLAMAAATYIPDDETAEGLEDARQKTFSSEIGERSNSLYCDPICLGKVSGLLKGTLSDEDLRIISEPVDFIGLNVYQPSNPLISSETYDIGSFPSNSLGWVIDGRCLYWTIRHYYDRYHLPVMVTENGMASDDRVQPDGLIHDKERSRFINEFLLQMKRAVDEGIPVLGYQYWSVMDNMEWCEGYDPRFGLIHVDYRTLKRTIKDSAKHYTEIIRSNGECLRHI